MNKLVLTEKQKYKLISIFHRCYYDTDLDTEEFSKEFFDVVSTIQEGIIPAKLKHLSSEYIDIIIKEMPELADEFEKNIYEIISTSCINNKINSEIISVTKSYKTVCTNFIKLIDKSIFNLEQMTGRSSISKKIDNNNILIINDIGDSIKLSIISIKEKEIMK